MARHRLDDPKPDVARRDPQCEPSAEPCREWARSSDRCCPSEPWSVGDAETSVDPTARSGDPCARYARVNPATHTGSDASSDTNPPAHARLRHHHRWPIVD